jgi:hypothetical protein
MRVQAAVSKVVRRGSTAGVVLGLVLVAACGGGGSDPAPGGGGGGGGSGGSGTGGGAVITAALQSGSYLEFLATSVSSSATPSGSSSSSDYGVFRIVLGAPAVVGGVNGFSVSVTGKSAVGGHDFRPAWTFVGLSGQRWVGSSDGLTLTTLYDPQLPAGTTGFFLEVPATRRVAARSGVLEGSYNRYSGVILRDATSDGGCQLVLSVPICSDTSTSFSQLEYLKDGLGPTGYSLRIGYSTGGSAPQVINLSVTLELIGTSLTAADGTAVKPPPWSEVAPLPASRVNAFAGAVGDKIYLYGGSSGDAGFSSDRIDVFDITSGAWSRSANAPRLLGAWRGVSIGGRMAMFNGSQGLLHDPVAGTWTPTAALSASGLIIGLGAWTHDGTTDVVALLDRGVAYVDATLYRYSVSTNTWHLIGTLDKGQRFEYETAIAGDRIYLIGGFANGTYLRSVQAFDLRTSQDGPRAGEMSAGRIGMSVAVLDGQIHIMGGYNYGGASRSVQVLDPSDGTISEGPAMFAGRHGAATAVVGGRIYVMGGYVAGAAGISRSVAVFDGRAAPTPSATRSPGRQRQVAVGAGSSP